MGDSKKLKVTWICQGGFVFEADGIRVVVDPYITDVLAARGLPRMQKVPLSVEQLKPDMVLFTHDHADHYDPASVEPLVKAYPHCVFAGPTSTFEHFSKMGFDKRRFVTLDKGDAYAGPNMSIKAVAAYHSDKLAVGYLISMGGREVYISGDTLFEKNLAADVAKASGKPIDLVFICINGRLGNMRWAEAVNVAAALKPRIAAVPMHYGLFAANTEDPAPFKKSLTEKGVHVELFEAGQTKCF